MPRYRVEVKLRTERLVDIEVWAESEDAAKTQAEKDAGDEDFDGWDEVSAEYADEIAPEPGDPECPPDRLMRALGMPELPGLDVAA